MNPNATVDQTCSNGFGSQTCACGWKSCPCPKNVDYILKVRRRGDPQLPPREREDER